MYEQGYDNTHSTDVEESGREAPPPSPTEDSVSFNAASSLVNGDDSRSVSGSNAAVPSSGRADTAKAWYEKESLIKFVTPCSIGFFGMNNSGV